ncbi:MAG: hypothetical protein QM764_00640 [Chitinophagaceae bacterium]
MKKWSSIFLMLTVVACSTRSEKETIAKNNWEIIGPGGGGATFIPTFSYHSPDKFLLRCDMTGSYLTEDGGQSFRQINFPNGAASFAYDPLDSNTIYVGSAVLNKSIDGGKSWDTIFPKREEITREFFLGDHANYKIETSGNSLYETKAENISNVRIDPMSDHNLYISMGGYFLYSADAGASWKKEDCGSKIQFIYTNNENLKDSVFIFTENDLFVFDKKTKQLEKKELPAGMQPAFSFTGGITKQNKSGLFYALHNVSSEAGSEFGNTELWKSSDGYHWAQVKQPFIVDKAAAFVPSYSMITCSEFNAEKAYLITNRYKEIKDTSAIYWYGAIKTDDAGDHWDWKWKGGGGSGQYGIKDGRDADNLTDAWARKAFGGEYIRLMDAGVDPYNGDIAIITDWYRTMKTIDGGKNWQQVYSHREADGAFANNGLNVTTTYGVHFDPFDSNHIAISYTDIGYHHSFNRGKSWERSVIGVPSEWVNTCYWVAFDPAVHNRVWSAWSGMHDFPRGKMTRNPKWKEQARGGICVSDDGGKTWRQSSEGMGFDSPTTSIVIDPKSKPGNRTLYAAVYNKGIFKSTDDGKTWVLRNKGIGENTCVFGLTLTGSGDLFVTIVPTPAHRNGRKGREFFNGAVYRSNDGAESWTHLNVTDSLFFPNNIESDPGNPKRLFIACWSDIDLSDLVGGDVVRETGGNQRLKMPGGIFSSEDGGTTWKSIFDQRQYVYAVTVDPYHVGRLYTNTFNRAAYRSDNNGLSWQRIKDYDFHWGHRVIVDKNDPEKIYLTTYGSSVWHGLPLTDK